MFQESQCQLFPGSEAVHCRSCTAHSPCSEALYCRGLTAHCPKAKRHCIAVVALPTAPGSEEEEEEEERLPMGLGVVPRGPHASIAEGVLRLTSATVSRISSHTRERPPQQAVWV